MTAENDWLERVRSVDASAASEIESLQGELLALRAELAGAREVLTEYDKVVDSLRAENERLRNERGDLTSEITSLEIKVEMASGYADKLKAENERLQRSVYVAERGWSTEQERIASAVEPLRAENERLREALERILERAGPGDNSFVLDECATIARAAIGGAG